MKDLIGRKGVKRCIVDLRVKNEKGENADAKLPVAVGVEMGRLREGDMGVIRDLEVFKGKNKCDYVTITEVHSMQAIPNEASNIFIQGKGRCV